MLIQRSTIVEAWCRKERRDKVSAKIKGFVDYGKSLDFVGMQYKIMVLK